MPPPRMAHRGDGDVPADSLILVTKPVRRGRLVDVAGTSFDSSAHEGTAVKPAEEAVPHQRRLCGHQAHGSIS